MKNKKYIYIVLVILVEFSISAGVYYVYKNTYKKEVPIATQVVSTLASTTIISFGDSLTAGYGLPSSESYPAQLEAILINNGYSVKVINAGVSGETSRGNNERATFVRNQNPDIVVLGIGGNDALRGLSIDELDKNLKGTIEIIQSGDNPPKVLLLGMQAPQNAGLGYKKQFDALFDAISVQYNIKKIDFIQPEVFLQKDLLLQDGIHPTKEGYRILVEKYIYPEVKVLLEKKQF